MITKNRLLDFFTTNEAGLRIIACLPDNVDSQAVSSLYPLLYNLSDGQVSVDELASAYISLHRLIWQLS